ncbi:eCIS core domain-containing protein [Nostoc sp.]|uniref:eCIS core domain-containing protein n=1 Tax=Nostoc sp. TaxID=1180 RepID=UPI002FF47921
MTQSTKEDVAFAEQKMEAFGLELQAKYGKITPEGQERLTVLQAKMDGLLNSQLQHARRFSHNIANIPLRRPDTPIQAKLTIGEPGDKYEQEADETARQVVQRIHQPQSEKLQRESLPDEKDELQMKPLGNIQRESLPDEEEELQMKPMVQRMSDGGMAATQDLEASINQARGGGQPLAKNIREPMEQGFGADFSRVKVHTDTQADQLNRSIQAKAFTTGQDVFFRQGAYEPGSRGGQELLAHELTHVVQQNGGTVQRKITKGEGGKKFDLLEHLLVEFSESYREKINTNKELSSLLEQFVNDDKLHSIKEVMNLIQDKVGKITDQECADILFDPVANQWVVPDDIGVWQTFIQGYKKSNGKMKLTYAEFAERTAMKAEQAVASKIPIDIENEEQLRSLWGSRSDIDKMERISVIVEMFKKSGYKVTNIEESTRSSSSNPPMLFDIEGHPTIKKFEIHPGGGIHQAPYIRISTHKGMIKVINKNSDPAYNRLTEKGVKYVEVSK